jgi:hypothetical protein
MNSPADNVRVRITVMLGSSDADRTTLEILGLLTAETRAEILGLFLEDPELLALAELPVAREYCQLTHAERRLEVSDLERQLRIQARAAEQALAGIAGRSGFNWSFRTVRGSLAGLLADATREMDLLLLGTAHSIRPLVTSPALPRPVQRPVAVIFDGSEAAQRAVIIARRMASAGKQALVMLLVAADPDDLQALYAQAGELVGPAAVKFRELTGTEPGEILAAANAARASALVVGLSELLPPASIELLRNRLRCPAVLVK